MAKRRSALSTFLFCAAVAHLSWQVKADETAPATEEHSSDDEDPAVVPLNYLFNTQFEQQCEHDDSGDDESYDHKPILVLIHGVDDSSHTFFDMLTDEDDEERATTIHWPTIALDLRGYGTSPLGPYEDHDENIAAFGPEAMVEDIRHTLDAIFTDCANKFHHAFETDIIILGHSMGSRVAMMYAAKYPENIQGLIVEDSDIQNRDRDEFPLTLEDPGVKGFPKSFESFEAATKALIDIGYDDETVMEDYHDEERIRETSIDADDGSTKKTIWSDVNPERRVLGYETILSTDKGKVAWKQIADQVDDGHDFHCFIFLAEHSITDDDSIEEMENVFDEKPNNDRRLHIYEFDDSSHNIHNTDRHNYLEVLHHALGVMNGDEVENEEDGSEDETVTSEL